MVMVIGFVLLAACAPLGAATQAPGQAPTALSTTAATLATTANPSSSAIPVPNTGATASPAPLSGAPATILPSPSAAASGAPQGTPLPTQPLSTPAAPSGWKTYTDVQAGFQIDYPADWTVADQNGVVNFWLEPGPPISLAPVNTGGLSPEVYLANADMPNTHCTQEKSRFGMAYSRCFDTIARSNSAQFLAKDAQGGEKLFSLSAGRSGDMQVLNKMLDSLRPIK
jgi:hypothetical protein